MSNEKNVYKDTLNLPKTDFDMRANLLTKEPVLQARWHDAKAYEQIRKARQGAKRFILHDGPPYANGNIHMGHALNKVLKDMVVRIRIMEGYDAPYIPGWDCHGLPIEQKVADELGAALRTLKPIDIRKRCRAYAQKYVDIQSQQFQRLGVLGEFDRPYITMDGQYESSVLEVFARLCEQGLIRRQLRPVHWSIENRTALADAELEYHDREDPSIYVLMTLAGDSSKAVPHEPGDRVGLMVWTTTPWTLPANRAVAVHPEYEYLAVHGDTAVGGITFIVARQRLEAVLAALAAKRPGWLTSHRVLGTLSGQALQKAGLSYEHPILKGHVCPVVPANYVTLEDGTGLVHTAPGHGMEDYGTGLKHGLEIACPVQVDGTFDRSVPEWLTGLTVWQANPKVVDHLALSGALVLQEKLVHSYPHDWRSKTPTIFRATEQWFVAVDKPLADSGRSLRDMALETCRRESDADGVTFVPAWGRNRIAGMLETRPDWCISRQRSWGLPIPAFCNRQGKWLMTPASIRAVARTFANEGSDAWFQLCPQQLLDGYDPQDDPDVADPAEFILTELTRGEDIFDVWFESGSSWFAVAVARDLVNAPPVDLYLEGSDQHRGWFQLSLLPSLGAAGVPPFKTVLTHGFTVDEEGRKMSKSLGNVVNAVDQLERRGADILRLWTASQNYQDDIRCSESLIAQAEDTYRKVRNTLRFCLGACGDFDPAVHAAQPAPHSVDLWMRMELHRLIRDVRDAFDRYEFHKATRLLQEFCTVEVSSVYFSAVKDRLYCEAADSPRRRATQTVIHELMTAMIKLLAPILPHTCQEAWEHLPHRDPASPAEVHFASLPEVDQEMVRVAESLQAVPEDQARFVVDELRPGPLWVWQQLMQLRSAGLMKLEALRNAGVKNALEAEAVFKVRPESLLSRLLPTYLSELEDLLGVGYARIEPAGDLPEGLDADVDVADARDKYPRCARCWKRRPDVGSDRDYPDLSARDAAVVRSLKSS